jgi:hypothetical protein
MRFNLSDSSHRVSVAPRMFGVALLWLLTVTAVVLLCGKVVWDGKLDAERQSDVAAANIATAVEQDIARNFEMYDLSLNGVIEALADPEAARLTGRVRQLALFDHAATATYNTSC